MYDNQTDPYQMKNLIASAAHAELQKELERRLQSKLKQTGDTFLPGEQSLKAWGYTVDRRSCIPYQGDYKVQSPGKRPK